MIIHIDCNNFFASCELADRPDLQDKPVVVSSDNEAGGGIILALNNQAKTLGVKRGIPLFKAKELIEREGIIVLPVNHKKYGNISGQIMQHVRQQDIVQNFIQYSIDEFFGVIPIDEPSEVERYIRRVKDLIWTTTKIPVSCGCSQSYTLAKCATWFAKHYKGYNGVCVLTPEKRDLALKKLAIEDVWGIGRKLRAKIQQYGVRTAFDFTQMSEGFLRHEFNVAVLNTWMELRGVPSIVIERNERQESIMQSKTFPRMVQNIEPLQTSVSVFAASVARRLRAQGSVCRTLTLFIATNRHREDLPQYKNGMSVKLVQPTNDTPSLIKVAVDLLEKLYRPGYLYKQAGVVVTDIVPDTELQLDLFSGDDVERKRRLMQVTDAINAKYGTSKIHTAAEEKQK